MAAKFNKLWLREGYAVVTSEANILSSKYIFKNGFDASGEMDMPESTLKICK